MAYKRGLGKKKSDLALADLYKHYKSIIKNPVDYKTYSSFLKEYNDRIMKAIIYENLEYRMPCRMGYFRIQRRRIKPLVIDGVVKKTHLKVDWARTLKIWREKYQGLTDQEISDIKDKKIYRYTNDHTNGYSCRFFWDKRYSNIKHQSCYAFIATRTAKETLARFIKKTGLIEYFD